MLFTSICGTSVASFNEKIQAPGLDAKTDKPLFNDTAWDKASNVLKEILAGHGSDPPGVIFYHPSVHADGSIAKDRYGLTLYDCVRGNGMVECIHKQLVDCFGRWRAGPRLAKALLQEWRHRFNQRMSVRRRAGFPKIGHYDTWLIDELQLLVWRNHGKHLYPHWSNSSHYVSTPEKMDFVSMQNEQCTTIVNNLTLTADVQLTADMRFLAKQSGTILPFVPVCGQDECLHFSTNVKDYMQGSTLNAELMALDWCSCSDGLTIFPKLPVHLRLHMEKWKKGERAANHLRKIEGKYDLLMSDLRAGEPSRADSAAEHEGATTPAAAPTAAPLPASPPVRRVMVTAHTPMPYVAPTVVQAATPMLVGRIVVGAVASPTLEKRKRGPRVCRSCIRFGTSSEKAAASHKDTKHDARCCPLFHATGDRKASTHYP